MSDPIWLLSVIFFFLVGVLLGIPFGYVVAKKEVKP